MKSKSSMPPHSSEAEMCVLGSVMLASKGAIVGDLMSKLRADHFWKPAHKIIWRAFWVLWMEDSEIDLVTVKNQLEYTKQLQDAGGWEYLAELNGVVPAPSHGAKYADIVLDYWQIRMVKESCQKVLNSVIDDPDLSPSEKVAKAQELINSAYISQAVELNAGNVQIGNGARFIPWQMGLIDPPYTDSVGWLGSVTGGIPQGQYMTVEAPSGVGKSWVSQQTALDMLRAGKKVRIATLADMSPGEILERMLVMIAGTAECPQDERLAKIWNGYLSELRGYESQFEFYDGGAQGCDTTVQAVCAWFDRKQQRAPADLCIVDYAQQLTWQGRTSGKLEEQTLIAQYLGRWISRHRDLGLMVLSQVNEKGDTSWGTELLKGAAIRVRVDREEQEQGEPERLKFTILKHRFKPVTGWGGSWIRNQYGRLYDAPRVEGRRTA